MSKIHLLIMITRQTMKIALFFMATFLFGKTYYVNPVYGQDSYEGTSILKPWKTLERINKQDLKKGDRILLASGYEYKGTIILKNKKGTIEEPIVISSYILENILEQKAHINAKGHLNGILIENSSHILVENLEITANGTSLPITDEKSMRCGILVLVSDAHEHENIILNDVYVHNVFFNNKGLTRGEDEIKTANGTQSYGWGIRFINNSKKGLLKNLVVKNSIIKNVAHTGLKFTSKFNRIFDLKVYNNQVQETGGPGIQMSGVHNGHVYQNYVNKSGSNDDSRKWGRGSGLWTWGSKNVLIEKNTFMNANGPGDSAGVHIDFNCSDIVVQYNFSADNAGGFCEILGNNYNCSYRYNISVNDGHRIKDQNGAFQEGKIFWLSGFCEGERRGPYNSYFYNNTIYVKKDIVAKIAVDRVSNGVLIANNIFYIEGESKIVKGDQYNPETEGEWNVKDIFFKNNLFLKAENWPPNYRMQDEKPIIGDPQFINKGGKNITDYIPQNIKLIKDKGIAIQPIPNDSIGLRIGLKVTHDILGAPIDNQPDLGAIEL